MFLYYNITPNIITYLSYFIFFTSVTICYNKLVLNLCIQYFDQK